MAPNNITKLNYTLVIWLTQMYCESNHIAYLSSCRTEQLATAHSKLLAVESGSWNGDLLVVRAAGAKWAKMRHHELHSGRTHPRIKASRLQRAPSPALQGTSQEKSVRDALSEYLRASANLSALGEQTQMWVAEDVVSKVSELFVAASLMESALTALTSATDIAMDVKKHAASQALSGTRKASAVIKQALQPFLANGVPHIWANCFRKLGLIPGKCDSDRWLPLEYKCETPSVVGDYDDWKAPAWFSLESAAEGSTAEALNKLLPAIGSERVDAKVKQLSEFSSAALAAGRGSISLLRCMPQQPAEYSKYEWIPHSLRGALITPEAVSSWGAPWIMRNEPAAARYGAQVWPVIGAGGFLLSLSGSTFVCAWPMKWTCSVNVCVTSAFGWVGSLDAKQFNAFFTSAPVWHTLLDPTEVAWIPHGYSVVTMSLAHEGSVALWVPYANATLMSIVDTAVVKQIAGAAETITGDESCEASVLESCTACLSWLTGVIDQRDDQAEDSSDSEESSEAEESDRLPSPASPESQTQLEPAVEDLVGTAAEAPAPAPAKKRRRTTVAATGDQVNNAVSDAAQQPGSDAVTGENSEIN